MILHKIQFRARLPHSYLRAMVLGLCAMLALPLPQLVVLVGAQTNEELRPSQEEHERSAREEVVSSRQRIGERRQKSPVWSELVGGELHQTSLRADRLQAIVGHQLSNGLRAPLRT